MIPALKIYSKAGQKAKLVADHPSSARQFGASILPDALPYATFSVSARQYNCNNVCTPKAGGYFRVAN